MEKNNVKRFQEITEKMVDTYKRKNHDYGDSFDKLLEKFGLNALLIHIFEKYNRLETLSEHRALVLDESIQDTLLDMANYCIMAAMWQDAQGHKITVSKEEADQHKIYVSGIKEYKMGEE